MQKCICINHIVFLHHWNWCKTPEKLNCSGKAWNLHPIQQSEAMHRRGLRKTSSDCFWIFKASAIYNCCGENTEWFSIKRMSWLFQTIIEDKHMKPAITQHNYLRQLQYDPEKPALIKAHTTSPLILFQSVRKKRLGSVRWLTQKRKSRCEQHNRR